MALLWFDFQHGDVVRFLGNAYTNANRKFDDEWIHILQNLKSTPPPEYPPLYPCAAFSVQTQGAPLKANYVSPYNLPALREQYDNHPAVAGNTEAVETKFAKEEWCCYHLHYHRWLFVFLYGLMINPVQWVFKKGKGRICIDCTNGPDKRGSVNTYIPKPVNSKKPPKNMKLDFWECPPTHFKFAFKRVLRRILRMRITYPKEPILGHVDDVDAAFRRILYHPDVAIAFGYVFGQFLIIPISQVFGSRSSPTHYGLLADVREVLTACRPMEAAKDFATLVKSCKVVVDSSTPLVTIPPDSHHPPLTEEEALQPFAASYVDDQAKLAFLEYILGVINNSVQSAFEVFGASGLDPCWGDCLQIAKWEDEVSEIFEYLGFLINTHDITVT